MNNLRTRPYWHVDLKWVFGILAFLALWGAMLTNAFATLTERQNATQVTSSLMSNVLKTNGFDSAAAFNQLKAQAALLPDDAVITLPNLPGVTIPKTALMTKTNDELQKLVIDQLTGPMYEQGLDKTVGQLTQDTSAQQSIKQQVGLLGVISQSTHDGLLLVSKIALVSSLLWFAGLIYFSAGWGRLVSPGVVLLLVSPVGVMVGSLLELLAAKNSSLAGLIPHSVLASLAQTINSTYRPAMLAGVTLLAVAGIGHLITKNRLKTKVKA